MDTRTKKAGNRTKRAQHGTASADSPARFFRDIGKSALWSLLTGLLLLLIFSLVAYFTPDPNRWILPLGILAAALTALLGGVYAIRLHGHAAFLCGLSVGCVLFAVMLLASLFLIPLASGYPAWVSCLLHVGFLVLSVAGAVIGKKKPKRRKTKGLRQKRH